MFHVDERFRKISFQISSEMEEGFHVLETTNNFLNHRCSKTFPVLTMVQRELLMNAIKHGNKNEVSRPVRCSIELLSKNKVKIMVEDSGDGFNYWNLDITLLWDQLESNGFKRCGYLLINEFSDKVEFNNKGNCITALITLTN